MRIALIAVAPLACVTVGCATTSERRVELPEVHVVGHANGSANKPDALDVYDAETLFKRGIDLLEGDDWDDATPYFERLIREFPTDPHVLLAHYNRGVCYIHLERGDEAVAAFDKYLAMLPSTATERDRLDGTFKRGQALAVAKRYDEVVDLFDGMLGEDYGAGMEIEDRIEALVDAGVGHYMLGLHDDDPKLVHRSTAEARFLMARRLHREASERQRLDMDYFVSQAAFYLAELARLEFSELKLKFPSKEEIAKAQAEAAKSGAPDKTLESLLGEQLEEKCQRLLRAQFLYLRTIREGNAGWAGAAGYNVGQMYEELHDDMVNLPVPDDLTAEQADLYTKMVRKKVMILLEKAQKTWTATVDMATRTGIESEWSQKTRESLARLHDKMVAEAAATADLDDDAKDVAKPDGNGKDAS